MNDMPIIKLEVERMKHTIMSHLGAYNNEMGKAIEAQIERAIESYDWEGQVTRITHECIQERIQSYFKYGAGSRFIGECVDNAFKELDPNILTK